MRKVILERKNSDILLSDISEHKSIFAKRDNKLVGMVIEEGKGWILRFGAGGACCGHFDYRQDCLKTALKYKYLFYIEED